MVKRVVIGTKVYKQGKIFIFSSSTNFNKRALRIKREVDKLHSMTRDLPIYLPSKTSFIYKKDQVFVEKLKETMFKLTKDIQTLRKRVREEV